jgi:hypothetical protein
MDSSGAVAEQFRPSDDKSDSRRVVTITSVAVMLQLVCT